MFFPRLPKVAYKNDIVSLYGDFSGCMGIGIIPASDCLPADLEDTGGRNLENAIKREGISPVYLKLILGE